MEYDTIIINYYTKTFILLETVILLGPKLIVVSSIGAIFAHICTIIQ